MPSVAANAQLRTACKTCGPSPGLYLPRVVRPIRSGEPTSLERNKTSGPHTCNSLLPFRTIQTRNSRIRTNQLTSKQNFGRASTRRHLFQYEKTALSYRSRSVSDSPGVRPCPAAVETDCCGLSANEKKKKEKRQRQGCPAQRFGQVRLKTEAGSVC